HAFGLSLEDKQDELRPVSDSFGLLLRLFIFVLLGSQVDFGVLGQYGWPALAVVLVLVFIARPLSVLGGAGRDVRSRWSGRELLFLCWVRETGVIPAALAGMIAGRGVPHADELRAVVVLAIVITIGFQASTTGWWARKLDVEEKSS